MRILKYLLFGIANLFAFITYSQSIEYSNSNVETLSKTAISYKPNSLISSMSLSFVRFLDKRYGILLTLITTQQGSQYPIVTDSILLASGTRTTTINSPFYDTIHLMNDGRLNWLSIHFIDQTKIDFLKEMPITEFILIVNGQPMHIETTIKSRKVIRRIATGSF